jgi:hypothetical protein
MKNIIPILLIVAGLFVISVPNLKSLNIQSNVSTVQLSPDEMSRVGNLANIVKSSKATKDQKDKMASMWFAAADTFELSTIDMVSDKLPSYNEDLISMYIRKHGDLKGLFPGASEEMDKLFNTYIGEYPIKINDDNKSKLISLYKSIGWAFQQ